MEPIGLALNDFNFVIDPFYFAGMNGVITMVDNSITVALQHPYKGVYRAIFNGPSKIAPLIKSFASPGSGSVTPYVFEFFF